MKPRSRRPVSRRSSPSSIGSAPSATAPRSLPRSITCKTAGYAPLFRVGGQNDLKNSKMIIAGLGTGSLGLPDRDYYLRDTENFKTIRTQYVDHVTKMLSLAGVNPDQAKSDAQRILALETKL